MWGAGREICSNKYQKNVTVVFSGIMVQVLQGYLHDSVCAHNVCSYFGICTYTQSSGNEGK